MTVSTTKSKYFPYLALVIGVLALSLSAMFVRWATAPGPVTAFYRMAFAALLLAPFFALNCYRKAVANWRVLIFPVIAGVATSGDLSLWNTSLSYTTASNATLIGNSAPLWVALAGLFFFGARLKRNFWLGLALAMSGGLFIMGTDFLLHPRLGIGDLMALGTSFFYAGYYLATERGRRTLDAPTYSWMVALTAAITLLFINILLGNPLTGYTTQTWLAFLGAAIVSQVIGYICLSYALGHLPAHVVSPTMIAQPVITTLLAIPLLGEVPFPLQLVGGVMALAGIYLVNQSHPEIPEVI